MNTEPSTSPVGPATSHGDPGLQTPPSRATVPGLSPGPERLAFSVKETAAMLGVSEKTVRRLVARGLLRRSKALRHLIIPKKEIQQFLERTTA